MEMTEHRTAPALNEILDLEKQVWMALVDGNASADRALLSADFLGVYPTGFANRDDHVGQFADAPTMAAFDLSGGEIARSDTGHRIAVVSCRLFAPGCDNARSDADFVVVGTQKRRLV